MKNNRYFIIEPPKFTDNKWQLVTTSEKTSFSKIVTSKKFSLYFASKSLDSVLFAASKLGIKSVTIVGEKNRKVKCDRKVCNVNSQLILPALHEQLKKVVGTKFYNSRSKIWCVPTAELNKETLQNLPMTSGLATDFLIMVRQ